MGTRQAMRLHKESGSGACAGLIGYRAYRAAGEALSLGLYGFGAAAHLLVQVAREAGQRVYAFVLRPSVATFPLASANEAFARLRRGELQSAAVLIP